jgi:hypothetical protein
MSKQTSARLRGGSGCGWAADVAMSPLMVVARAGDTRGRLVAFVDSSDMQKPPMAPAASGPKVAARRGEVRRLYPELSTTELAVSSAARKRRSPAT